MTMDANHYETRADFRCGVCRQKNVFHCEHDTPYRDEYLGMPDSSTPRNSFTISRRSKSEPRTRTNSISNNGMNTGRHVNSNAGGAHYQQGKNSDKTNIDKQNGHPPSNTYEKHQSINTNEKQNQKSKSCVIL